ncbi:hypothetical protein BD626DRAFT_527588 [Schizophyllum amplum]|uniref:Uncharacterized protein n=1 Tax=Schizophyllum amplum TaxID=97359 RepID=A0A550BS64_9AGAR|nr:hypothetical protein BD626DRAFT_527588 [Auriculariopsis ampla]
MLSFLVAAVVSVSVEVRIYTVVWIRHTMLMVRKGFTPRRFMCIFFALSAAMYIAAFLHACNVDTGLMAYRVIHGINLAPDVYAQNMVVRPHHWHIRTISVLQFLQTIIGDLVLVRFRTYVAWSYSIWVLALPSHYSYSPLLVIRICLPASLAFNVALTVLLIWRLGAPVLLRIARVVAETGAPYVGTYAVFIVLTFMGRSEMYIVHARCCPSGVSMTFSLMSIRLYGIADERPDAWTWHSPTIWLRSGTASDVGHTTSDAGHRTSDAEAGPATSKIVFAASKGRFASADGSLWDADDYGRSTDDYGRSTDDYGRGTTDYGRSMTDHGRRGGRRSATDEYGWGVDDLGRGAIDYDRDPLPPEHAV